MDGDGGTYALQAQIAACHSSATTWEATDWPRIVALYDRLSAITESPVVDLNRAVAVGYARGPESGLEAMRELELDGYHAYHTTRGELLRRSGDEESALAEFERALQLSSNIVERRLIESRIEAIRG